MKYTLNTGEVIECTVEEYLQIIQSIINPKITLPQQYKEQFNPNAPVKKSIVQGNVKFNKPYTFNEDRILITSKSVNEMDEKLPGRSKSSIYNRLQYIRDVIKIKTVKALREFYANKKKNKTSQPEKPKKKGFDKRSNMMKFINKKTTEYRNSLNLSFNDAKKKAVEDYRNQQQQGKEKSFPILRYMNQESVLFIDTVVSNMLKTNRTLDYLNVNWIPLKDNKEWTRTVWLDFIIDFILKSNEIASYYGIQNKFKHIKAKSGYDIIVYE